MSRQSYTGGRSSPRTYCENCIREHARTQGRIERQNQAEEVRHKWERLCPPIYRDTDAARLTPAMRKYAETWTSEGGRGLAFVGATGKCKTRVCYMILARYHFDGQGVFGITAAKLAELVQNKFSNDNEIRGASVEKLKLVERIPLLLLDDVGQEKITERTGSRVLQLNRTAHVLEAPHPLDQQPRRWHVQASIRRRAWTANHSPAA